MKSRGPLLTMVAVVSLALVLLGINITGEPVPVQEVTQQAAPAAAPAAEEPPAEPAADTAADPPPAEPAAAEAAGAFPAEAAYAGRTAGNEATIAIAVKDGKAVAYLCDGKEIEGWLEGTVDGGKLDLTGAGGATVQGTLDKGAVFGRAAAKGKEWAFSAAKADAPAGAYRGSVSVAGATLRVGWTVLQDGTVTGLASAGGQTSPAPALDPVTRTSTLDGVAVQVSPLAGGDDVTP